MNGFQLFQCNIPFRINPEHKAPETSKRQERDYVQTPETEDFLTHLFGSRMIRGPSLRRQEIAPMTGETCEGA
jgi:hypothetical protein